MASAAIQATLIKIQAQQLRQKQCQETFPLTLWRDYLYSVATAEDIAVTWRIFTQLATRCTEQAVSQHQHLTAVTKLDPSQKLQHSKELRKLICSRLENVSWRIWFEKSHGTPSGRSSQLSKVQTVLLKPQQKQLKESLQYATSSHLTRSQSDPDLISLSPQVKSHRNQVTEWLQEYVQALSSSLASGASFPAQTAQFQNAPVLMSKSTPEMSGHITFNQTINSSLNRRLADRGAILSSNQDAPPSLSYSSRSPVAHIKRSSTTHLTQPVSSLVCSDSDFTDSESEEDAFDLFQVQPLPIATKSSLLSQLISASPATKQDNISKAQVNEEYRQQMSNVRNVPCNLRIESMTPKRRGVPFTSDCGSMRTLAAEPLISDIQVSCASLPISNRYQLCPQTVQSSSLHTRIKLRQCPKLCESQDDQIQLW